MADEIKQVESEIERLTKLTEVIIAKKSKKKKITIRKKGAPKKAPLREEDNDDLEADACLRSEEGNGKFKIQTRRYLLTYKTHIKKEEMDDFLFDLVKGKVSKFNEDNYEVVIAHENGDKQCPYKHTHVYLDTGSRFCSSDPRIFDFGEIHPNIKAVTKTPDKVKSYLGKEDPDNAHLVEKRTMLDSLLNAKTDKDAAKLYAKPQEMLAAVEVRKKFGEKQRLRILDEFEPCGWQLKVLKELSFAPDPRKIQWRWEPDGGVGKSEFCQWLLAAEPEDTAYLSCVGSAYHMATIIQGELDRGWNSHCLLINLSRNAKGKDFMYSTLEQIQDGIFTSQKYQGRTMQYNRPHIYIFANWPYSPIDEEGNQRLSLDRVNCERIRIPKGFVMPHRKKAHFVNKNYLEKYGLDETDIVEVSEEKEEHVQEVPQIAETLEQQLSRSS